MEPADSESLDQRIYGLGAWLPPMPEPLPTLDEQPQTAPTPQSESFLSGTVTDSHRGQPAARLAQSARRLCRG